jgi:hypothetical protein
MLRRITRGIVGRAGRAMSSLVISNDPETVFQSSDLVKPHPLSARHAVQKHHWRALPDICHGDVDVAG